MQGKNELTSHQFLPCGFEKKSGGSPENNESPIRSTQLALDKSPLRIYPEHPTGHIQISINTNGWALTGWKESYL